MDNKTPVKPTSIFKKYLLYVLIGGLITTASIAVVAIIIGEWNNAITKAIWLTISSWIHCLVALAIASALPNDDKKRSDYWNIFIYTLFGITIASFVTTVLNIFEIIPAYMAARPATNNIFSIGFAQTPTYITVRLYFWYFGLILASLVSTAVLNYSIKRDRNTQLTSYIGVGAIVLFMTLFFPPVFSAYIDFPEVYYRVILALAVVFSTTIILSVIFGHLYRVKHPELVVPKTDNSEYQRAVQIVISAGKGSTSILQRQMNIGYGKAAKLLDEMEANGIISPSDGTNSSRRVLVSASVGQAISAPAPAKKGLPAWAIVLIILGSVFIGLPMLFGMFISLLYTSSF